MSKLSGAPMITILSGDSYQVDQHYQTLKDDFLQTNPPAALSRLDLGQLDPNQAWAIIQTESLFYRQRLIAVVGFDDCQQLATSEAMFDFVSQLLATAAPNRQLVLILSAVKTNTKLGRLLRQQPNFVNYRRATADQLTRQLVDLAQSNQARITPTDARFLIDWSGADAWGLTTEITKLSLHRKIDQALIEQLVEASPKSRGFDLLAAILAGQLSRATQLYADQRSQSVEPLAILGLVVWQVQLLMIVKTSSHSIGELKQRLQLKSDYPLIKSRQIAAKLSRDQIKALIDHCLMTSRRIRCQYQDPDACLASFIIHSCRISQTTA